MADIEVNTQSSSTPVEDVASENPASINRSGGPSHSPSTLDSSDSDEPQRGLKDKVKIYLGLADPNSPIIDYSHKVKRTVRSVDEVHGYGKVAAFMDCAPEFLMTRKFGWLRNYALLCLQEDLVDMEHRLERLHGRMRDQDPRSLISKQRADVKFKENQSLLESLVRKFEQYDQLLLRTSQINSLDRPTSQNQNSLFNLISNTGSQCLSEAAWIHNLDDLVALLPDQAPSPVEALIVKIFKCISRRLTLFLFRTQAQRERSGSEDIHLFSHDRLDAVVSILINIIATAVLLASIVILDSIQREGLARIGIIFAFASIFATSCILLTKTTKQTTVVATAIYTAVLLLGSGSISRLGSF